MSEALANGTKQLILGVLRVYYDGYWIKTYEPPGDSLDAKKRLIEALTRRLFNHVEHGINIPGKRLAEVRGTYLQETDPELKRVKGAMLAGALFNRATDIFTKLVEIQALGVEIEADNALMQECGACLLEALDLGKLVRHRSGEGESIDELWGEPFKAFTMSVEAFYESRYVKIAQAMGDIDRVAKALTEAFADSRMFREIEPRIEQLANTAKLKCETLRTDPDLFEIWPAFVVAGDRLCRCRPALGDGPSEAELCEAAGGEQLLEAGKALLTRIARARVPMPSSTEDLIAACDRYRRYRLNGKRDPSGNPGLVQRIGRLRRPGDTCPQD